MRGTFAINDTERVEMTLLLTATLGEWRQIAGLVKDPANSAAWQIRRIIQEAVAKATQEFRVEDKP